jgi:pyridoxamine 5'-phosphate oxidase
MNPVQDIQSDRQQARQLGDANADICFLALADADGKASVRTLVLRDINDNHFTLFINKTSPKWRAFVEGTGHELLLWYTTVQRQYRISGSLKELDEDIVKSNWQRRPTGSKYLDYVYEELGSQSSTIESREILTNKIQQLKQDRDAEGLQSPPMVAGIELVADRIDLLDLNNLDRIHDRRLYTFDGGAWRSEVLIP